MNYLGACQCYTIILLSVAFFSIVIGAKSEVNTKRLTRHETQDNYTNSSGRESCVRAHSPVNRTLRRDKCHPYSAHARRRNVKKDVKPEVCRSILADKLLYATPREQQSSENLFVTYTLSWRGSSAEIPRMPDPPSRLLSTFCWRLIMHMYCKFLLPKCDLTSSIPLPQPICREACREFKNQCQRQWNKAQRRYRLQYNLISWGVQRTVSGMYRSSSLMACKYLPRRNGPDLPECYYPEMLKDKTDLPPITETCFFGDGQSYRGNISVTRSGYTCQSWSSQCPHRHHRTANNFPELKNASNACRNPGGQAPHGPWCYTTNPKERWEYCLVDKCEVQEKNEDE